MNFIPDTDEQGTCSIIQHPAEEKITIILGDLMVKTTFTKRIKLWLNLYWSSSKGMSSGAPYS